MLSTFFVENSTTQLKGLHDFISRAPGFHIVGETNDGPKGIELTRLLNPDLIIIGKDVLKLDWMTAARPPLTASQNSRLMLVPLSDQNCLLLRARQNGVMGYYVRYSAMSELTSAIQSVHAGQSHLARPQAPTAKKSRRRRARHAKNTPRNAKSIRKAA